MQSRNCEIIGVVHDIYNKRENGEILNIFNTSFVDTWILHTRVSHYMILSCNFFFVKDWNNMIKLGDYGRVVSRKGTQSKMKMCDSMVRKLIFGMLLTFRRI